MCKFFLGRRQSILLTFLWTGIFLPNRQDKLSASGQLNRLVFDPATCVEFAAKDFHSDPCFVGPCRRDVSVKQREKTLFWWWQLLGLALDRRCMGFWCFVRLNTISPFVRDIEPKSFCFKPKNLTVWSLSITILKVRLSPFSHALLRK